MRSLVLSGSISPYPIDVSVMTDQYNAATYLRAHERGRGRERGEGWARGRARVQGFQRGRGRGRGRGCWHWRWRGQVRACALARGRLYLSIAPGSLPVGDSADAYAFSNSEIQLG